jgi:two-component system cell cycle sensor histidine kinase/response regulator CckA
MALKLVVSILESANYRVLSADSGASAIKVAEQTDGPIHLLLSDVDMQKMSGPKLGQVLKNARANLNQPPGAHGSR